MESMDLEKRQELIEHLDDMVVGIHMLGLMLLAFTIIADPEMPNPPEFMVTELLGDARQTVDELFEAVGIDKVPHDDPQALVTELAALMFRLEMMTE